MKHTPFLCAAAALAVTCFAAGESAGQTAARPAASRQTAPSTTAPSPADKQRVIQEYGKLPLSFEANQGQTDPKVKFLSRGPGYQLFLLPDEAVLSLQQPGKLKRARR